MKVKGSMSWFVSSAEDVDFIRRVVEGYKKNVQIAFYERKDVEDWANHLLDIPSEYISSIHLPKHLRLADYQKDGLVFDLRNMFSVDMFVVHPWAEELKEIVEYITEYEPYCLCLENFAIKSGKASIFNLLADFGKDMRESDYLGLCLDLSHLDAEMGNYTVVKGLLPYLKMIHLSSKIRSSQHLPVFTRNADMNPLNLIGQLLCVKDLKVREISLEYMKEYQKELIKHLFWLDDFIFGKRKRWGG